MLFRSEAVIHFLNAQADAINLLSDIRNFIERWLPAYQRDNRSYLTVAIGCTGGQHRSVFMVEQLATHFKNQARVLIRHRELSHDNERS